MNTIKFYLVSALYLAAVVAVLFAIAAYAFSPWIKFICS